MILVWMLGAALAGEGELLTPRLDDVSARLDRIDTLLDEADSERRALVAIHHKWAKDGCSSKACERPDMASRIELSRTLGQRQRDLLQSARAQWSRVDRASESVTVAPLLDGTWSQRLEQTEARLDLAVQRWSVAAAWHREVLEPYAYHLGLLPAGRTCFASAEEKRR